MTDAVDVLMRWLHIGSVVLLVGGILYARLVVLPSVGSLPAEQQETLGDAMAARYRGLLYLALLFLLASGTYNVITHLGRGRLYHALLGIKLLLALHVFAVGFLVVKPKNPKRRRMMTGIVISGVIIIAISAVLRQLHM